MKRAFLIIATILSIGFLGFISTSASAQSQNRPPPSPETTQLLANAVVAITTGWFVVPAAVLTGKLPGLCKALDGKYTPGAGDQCPGGQWTNIIPFLQNAKQ